ncbi:hypothetical protein UlMin_000208 [Ulmus minor]
MKKKLYRPHETNYGVFPSGKYYLVDVGYNNKPGFLVPFHGQNYHLYDRTGKYGDHRKEIFNYRHASLRNVIERTFGIWKNRFRILRRIPHYTLKKQRDIVIACVVLHNFFKLFSYEATVFNPEDSVVDDDDDEDDVEAASTRQQIEENNYMAIFRDELANMI